MHEVRTRKRTRTRRRGSRENKKKKEGISRVSIGKQARKKIKRAKEQGRQGGADMHGGTPKYQT